MMEANHFLQNCKSQISPRVRTVWSVVDVNLKALWVIGYPPSAL